MGVPIQRTVSDVLQDILGNVQEIVRSEFKLAKVEVKNKAQRAARPAVVLAVGAAVGFYGLGFLFLAAVYALEIVVATWAAALIVGFLLAIVAGILLSSAQRSLRQIDPKPERTLHTVKENVQWTKERIK